VRVVAVVAGFALGGMLGFFVGMVLAQVVVSALGPMAEADYIGIKVLVPFATATLAAVAGGAAAARGARR
jgi:hypothetical protein